MKTSARSLIVPTIAVGAATIFGFFSVIRMNQIEADSKVRNKAAIAAGFDDYADMEAAKRQGFTSSAPWHVELAKRNEDEKRTASARLAELAERNRPATDRMKILDQSWEKSGFGSVAIMSVTISNANAFAVRDVVIDCRFYGNSGTALSERLYTIYDVIPANRSKKFRKLNVGFINSQSSHAGCDLETAARM